MANAEHLAILNHGVGAWNNWRKADPSMKVDLSEEDLSEKILSEVDLSGANLSKVILWRSDLFQAKLTKVQLNRAHLIEADLSEADLKGSDLTWADLRGTDLSYADLSQTKIREANLSGANLYGANLSEADLSQAHLSGVDFSEADLSSANLEAAVIGASIFGNVDLSEAINLEKVKHYSPSYISVETIYKSRGQIPEAFLRGAGVPDEWIKFIPSLVGALQPIQFYSCFISYSSKDQDLAERLHADLQAKGVRVWFAPEDLKIGDRFRERIEESIRVYDKLMVVLSENSVGSVWVEKEVVTAMDREERQGSTVLFPIRLDDTVMQSDKYWASEIRRTRHIGDFRQWKDHDSYKKAFDRLMRDLQFETPAAKE